MAFLQNRGDIAAHRVEWFELFGRLGVTAASYPFDYVKVLIQIGHEPLPPRPTRTLFGRPAIALPGVFTYMKHIRKVDGFTGLYRGLIPKLCTNMISGFTYRIVLERLPSLEPEELAGKNDEDLTSEQRLTLYMHGLIRETAARCVQIIASHPFHIITIRTMAQFVGREETYGGIFGSLKEIYNQDGILGFFSCLIPRMVGEILTFWFCNTAAFLINTYVVEEETLKSYVKPFMSYIASTLFYPFIVTSNVIIVNNCGLKAGIPPNMPIYSSWSDCWSHLSAIGQLKRGSSILWRYYSGPYMGSTLQTQPKRVYAQALADRHYY
ncbi:mitochondrial carrier homolog 2-like [Uloborus diversus]|uniref:mitochondrial carrier homolog 2-like n=1 Tax=Uloborus diversus TaxID=327109 RepID=UPI002409FD57|nr:mitochondrial carrier homolog 2-like [Uloborus diversus]